MMAKNGQRLSVSTTSFFLSEFFQISYMDCFHKTPVKVWILVLSDESIYYFYQSLTQVWIWVLSDNQDGHQMAATCQFTLVDTT